MGLGLQANSSPEGPAVGQYGLLNTSEFLQACLLQADIHFC